MLDLSQNMVWAPTLLLVIVRAVGIFMVAPVFGNAAVPIRLRVAMSIVVAVAVVGRLAQPVAMPAGVADLLLGAGCELLIGLLIGYAARLVFVGVEIGALYIGQQMGIGLGEVFDPFQAEGGAVRKLFQMLAIVIFLAIGGHRELIGSLMRTFDNVPLAGFSPTPKVLNLAVTLLGESFLLALKVAAPVLVAMLLATAALGLLQRTLPQCNVFSTGLPVRTMLALAVLAASLAVLVPLLEGTWSVVAGQIETLTQTVK